MIVGREDLMGFIKTNFDCIEDYVYGLNKVGVKETLPIFGVEITHSSSLDVATLHIVLLEVLKFYWKGFSQGAYSTEDEFEGEPNG
jgi:hypothetical protein